MKDKVNMCLVCGSPCAPLHSRVQRIIAEERSRGLNRPQPYRAFARETDALRKRLMSVLTGLIRDGHTIAAYGEAAKGNTLLNCLGLDPGTIGYIADRNPMTQGLYAPGTSIPVVHPDRLLEDQPDYTLLLTWNFIDEILDEQAEYCARGGKFLIPVPEPAIVSPRNTGGATDSRPPAAAFTEDQTVLRP